MTYTFGDFMGLLIVAWLIVFLFHQLIGGLLGIFSRAIGKKNRIVVELKDLP